MELRRLEGAATRLAAPGAESGGGGAARELFYQRFEIEIELQREIDEAIEVDGDGARRIAGP